MKAKLLWAMMVTFLVMGGFLAAVFWVALSIFGVTGTPMLMGIVGFVAVMVLIQWAISPALIKRMSRAKKCQNQDIIQMVHEIAEKTGIPKPEVYIIPNESPNAFAFGRTQKTSSIALHTGLINQLNEEELEGVIAHEAAHIKHRDVTVMTIASALPMILFYVVFFGSMMAGGNRNRGGGFFGAWIGAMVAQFVGSLVVLYLSRVREYYADTKSAYVTKNPAGLINALQKITSYQPRPTRFRRRPTQADTTLKNLYIAEPMMAAGRGKRATEIFMSHPLTEKRVKNLEEIEF